MQPRHVSSFQNALHEGRWAESLELLPGLAPDMDTQQQVAASCKRLNCEQLAAEP